MDANNGQQQISNVNEHQQQPIIVQDQNLQQDEGQQNIQQQNQQLTDTLFDKRMTESQRIQDDSKGQNDPDSAEMRAVKTQLKNVTDAMQEQMNPELREFKVQLTTLKDHYNNLILACDHYLDTKWTAKLYFFGKAHRRRKMVEDLKKMARAEADCLLGLSKDKEFFKNRVEGQMLGTAISSAVRDFQASKRDLRLSDFQLDGDVYIGTRKDPNYDYFNECVFQKKNKKLTDGMSGNVCATRLAKLAGLDGIVQRTDLVTARGEQNRVHYGIEVEALVETTADLATIKEREGNRPYKITYTGEALRQISNARIFHMLLGGTSFNNETDMIMVFDKSTFDGETVYQVTSAYLNTNDSFFSTGDNTKSMEKLFSKNDFVMSSSMADAIMNMDVKDLEYVGGEMLSKERREAFKKRLTYMQTWVRTTRQREDKSAYILEDGMWSDKESLMIMRDQMQETAGGLYKGFLSQSSSIEETEGDVLSNERKEYRQLYEKVKKAVEGTKDLKERVLIIGALSETVPYYEETFKDHEKYKNDVNAAQMIMDIQTRLISENASEEFLAAFHEVKKSTIEPLADALNEEKARHPKNKNAEYDTINENRTLYRNYMFLDSFGNALYNSDMLGRDLRHSKMREFNDEREKKYIRSLPEDQQVRYAQKREIVAKMKSKFITMNDRREFNEFNKQCSDWAKEHFLKDPQKSLSVPIHKLEAKDEFLESIPKNLNDKLRRSYTALKNFKTFELPQPPVYKGAPDDAVALAAHKKAEKAFRDEIVNTGLMFMQFYNNLRNEIESFEKKTNATEEKNPVLFKKKKEIILEQMMFSNFVSEFLAGNKTYKKNTTWDDVIGNGIRAVYNLGGLKNLGGGTSDVYRVTGRNGKNKYFKPKEDLQKTREATFAVVAREEKDKLLNDKKISNEDKQILVRFENLLEKWILEDYKNTFEENESIYYNIVTTPMTEYKGGGSPRENTEKFFKKACYGSKERDPGFNLVFNKITKPQKVKLQGTWVTIPSPQLFEVLENLQKNTYGFSPSCIKLVRDYTVQVMTKFVFKLNQFEVTTGNSRIGAGRNISNRNVATSRIAGVLGIGRLVAHSETAVAQKDGKLITGNLMEEAKGEMIKQVGYKVVEKDGRRTFVREKQRYSLNAIKDINTMRIFDILLGQTDRHEENFHHVTHQEKDVKEIDTVHMIDNDMCGGMVTVEDIKKGIGVTMPYDREELRALPNEVLEKFRSMDISIIKLMVGDIFDEEELKALDNRLRFIQSEIEAIDREQQKLLDSDKKEDIEKAFYMQFDDYRALIFAKYEREKLDKDVQEPGDTRYRPFAKDGLPTKMEIAKRITAFKNAKKAELAAWKQKHLEKKEKAVPAPKRQIIMD